MSAAARDILFLAHRIPYPPDRGDKIRSFNIVKRLSTIARVHIAAFADDAADAANEAGLRAALRDGLGTCHIEVRRRSRGASLIAGTLAGRSASMAAFSSSFMRRAVARMLTPDMSAIFAFSGQMSQYVPENTDKRFVMDFVDVDSAKFESYADDARAPIKWLYRREAARLAVEEAAIAARADVSLFVSEAEAALFRQRSGLGGDLVRALGNGVDLAFFDPAADFVPLDRASREPLLVFAGQMNYAPNVAAVVQFARETLPLIRRHAHAAFAVVGRDPVSAVQALGALPGVEVVGSVPDIRPWLAAADVVVAPLQIARGVQNKVLEAMAMARPVVASTPAFEGINAMPGTDLLIADGAEETAAAVSSLLHDRRLRADIGRAARARMCERYAWDRQLADLPRLMFG